MEEDYTQMYLAKLRRMRDQAWEMAGLARQDGDHKDAIRLTKIAEKISDEIRARLE